jgi:uncharacterized membrane protein YgcG
LISRLNDLKRRVLVLCAFFICASTVHASYVIVNDNIINPKVTQKVESLGSELFSKTGVSVYVAVPESLEKMDIKKYEESLLKGLKEPFVVFTLAKSEQKVDIVNSNSLDDKFDKESTLSPFPWAGTVIPILAVKKENDKYNAAVLNGYADIVEQIAASYNVKLEGALGSTNKNIYYYIRILIYGFLIFIISRYFYKLLRRKNDKN